VAGIDPKLEAGSAGRCAAFWPGAWADETPITGDMEAP
jgi:hypothetical protein